MLSKISRLLVKQSSSRTLSNWKLDKMNKRVPWKKGNQMKAHIYFQPREKDHTRIKTALKLKVHIYYQPRKKDHTRIKTALKMKAHIYYQPRRKTTPELRLLYWSSQTYATFSSIFFRVFKPAEVAQPWVPLKSGSEDYYYQRVSAFWIQIRQSSSLPEKKNV